MCVCVLCVCQCVCAWNFFPTNPYLQAGLTDLDEIWHDGRSWGVASPKKILVNFGPLFLGAQIQPIATIFCMVGVFSYAVAACAIVSQLPGVIAAVLPSSHRSVQPFLHGSWLRPSHSNAFTYRHAYQVPTSMHRVHAMPVRKLITVRQVKVSPAHAHVRRV